MSKAEGSSVVGLWLGGNVEQDPRVLPLLPVSDALRCKVMRQLEQLSAFVLTRLGHYTKVVRLLSTQDHVLFREWCRLAYRMEDEQNIRGLFREKAAEEANQRPLEELREREQATFVRERDDVSGRRAAARELTVVAELNGDFVADGKVWRWIELAMTT